MSQPTKADLAGPITERLNGLDVRVSKIEGAGSMAKWIAGISVAVLLALFGGLELSANRAKIAALEAQCKELKGSHDKVAAGHEKLLFAHERLRANVVVLYDRQPKGPVGLEAIVYSGRIIDLEPDSITVLVSGLGEPARKFLLPAKVDIKLDGRAAQVSDLEVGMRAAVTFLKQQVTLIEADTE